MGNLWFAVPGELETPTGGYVYARRILSECSQIGHHISVLTLSAEFPDPSASALKDSAAKLAALAPGSRVLFDGLALGALPRELLDPLDLDIVALVHHPLALETGLDPARAITLACTEEKALAKARAVICTSQHTCDLLMKRYRVPHGKLRLAPPGCDATQRALGGNMPPVLLTVATLTPRKGHDILIDALAKITDLSWRSRVIGSGGRDPATMRALRNRIAAHGIGNRVALEGAVTPTALEAAFVGSDIFVLPSRYEGYGMVFAEAMAHGLPIIACRVGAVADTVPEDVGLLVGVDDTEALANALRYLLSHDVERCRMAEAAYKKARTLPSWQDTSRIIADVMSEADQ